MIHLDDIKEKKKAYRNSHKEEYKAYCIKNAEKFKTPINCQCGSVVTKRNYCTHIKTLKHIEYINSPLI